MKLLNIRQVFVLSRTRNVLACFLVAKSKTIPVHNLNKIVFNIIGVQSQGVIS